MKTKRFLVAWVLFVLVCGLIVLWSGSAHAADKSTSGLDKDLSSRTGVDGSLAPKKELDDEKKAKPYQMAIGVGSIFVMIAVVKWL